MQLRSLTLILLMFCSGPLLACENFTSLRDGDWRTKHGDDPAWALPDFDDRSWSRAPMTHPQEDGFLWYRLNFRVDTPSLQQPCHLFLGRIQEVDEVFLNGARIGGTGRIGPRWFDYVSGMGISRTYAIPADLLRADQENVLAIRTFSMFMGAGMVSTSIGLGPTEQLLHKATDADRLSLHFEVMTLTLLALGALMVAFMSMNRRDEPQIWLLLGMILVVMVNYGVDSGLLYPLRLEAPWLKRLIFLAVPALPLLILTYLKRVTAQPISRWLWALALLPVPVAFLYLFNIPTRLAVTMYDVWHLSFVPIAVVLPLYVARRARYSIRNIGLLRAAAIILVLTLMYDLLGGAFLPSDLDATELGILAMTALFMVAFARRVAQDHEARKRLSAGVLSAQDEERRRIARELHDGLGQRLVAARLLLEAEVLQKPDGQLQEVVRELRDTTRELRAIVHGLRPVELGEVSLRSALKSYGQRVRELTGMQVQIEYTHHGYISGEVEEHLFRIFQEAVNNAMRHGGAREMRIELSGVSPQLNVRITDDGSGFLPEAGNDHGLGLTAMAERVRLCHGHFHVESRVGEGTTLRIEIPLA
jgi:signal transduction histidine kinase